MWYQSILSGAYHACNTVHGLIRKSSCLEGDVQGGRLGTKSGLVLLNLLAAGLDGDTKTNLCLLLLNCNVSDALVSDAKSGFLQ